MIIQGQDRALGLCNTCIPDIPIASPCISSLCPKAECAYPELWQGLVLHSRPWYDPYVRSQGAIRWIGLSCRTTFTIELLQAIAAILEDCQHALAISSIRAIECDKSCTEPRRLRGHGCRLHSHCRSSQPSSLAVLK